MGSLVKLSGVIIVAAVVAGISCFISAKNVEKEIVAAMESKNILDEQLKRYVDIDARYGRASDDFFSDKPIVVLHGKGATDTVRVFRSNKSRLVAERDEGALKTDWGEDDETWAAYTITSNISHGYTPVIFTNKQSKEKFEVLVIVK